MQCWVWLWSSTATRPVSSQTSDNERIRQRRKNIDDSSNRQSEYRGCRSEWGEVGNEVPFWVWSCRGSISTSGGRRRESGASSSTSGCRRSKRSGSVASSRGWCSWVWGILQGRTDAAEVCHGDRKIPGPAELHVAPPLAARRRDWWAVYPRRWIGCGWGAACIVTPRVRDLRRIGGVDQDTSSEFRGNYQKTIQQPNTFYTKLFKSDQLLKTVYKKKKCISFFWNIFTFANTIFPVIMTNMANMNRFGSSIFLYHGRCEHVIIHENISGQSPRIIPPAGIRCQP